MCKERSPLSIKNGKDFILKRVIKFQNHCKLNYSCEVNRRKQNFLCSTVKRSIPWTVIKYEPHKSGHKPAGPDPEALDRFHLSVRNGTRRRRLGRHRGHRIYCGSPYSSRQTRATALATKQRTNGLRTNGRRIRSVWLPEDCTALN